jgi:bacillithiol synthase
MCINYFSLIKYWRRNKFMKLIAKLDFDQITAFTDRDIQYQIKPELFSPFLKYTPDEKGLLESIGARGDFKVNRTLLVDELYDLYHSVGLSDSQKANIESLKSEDTFTVITAHQPSLFTGPIYFIYKIFSCINLAQELTVKSGKHVVPVFILGSEDHDFDEVNYANVFNKRIEWTTQQTGPVGRFHKDGLDLAIAQLKEILGNNENAIAFGNAIDYSMEEGSHYNDFVFRLLNKLFAKYGLIIGNMDRSNLKRQFIPHIKAEIFYQRSFELVNKTQDELEKVGYNRQAHVREINIFYMKNAIRERIIFEDGNYKILNTDLSFTKDALEKEIEDNPQNFSPNVVMRPLYQESIWPNIAYIGGGGELAYWIERKAQFEAFGIFYPVLIRRNSVLILKQSQKDTLEKLNVSIQDLFNQEDNIINKYLSSISSFELKTEKEVEEIKLVFSSLKQKAVEADKSLDSFVEAEEVKALKQLEQIESRIKRAFKKNEETSVNQIKNLKAKLFPNNGMQERTDNFLNFYLSQGEGFFDAMKRYLDPLDKQFIVLSEE